MGFEVAAPPHVDGQIRVAVRAARGDAEGEAITHRGWLTNTRRTLIKKQVTTLIIVSGPAAVASGQDSCAPGGRFGTRRV